MDAAKQRVEEQEQHRREQYDQRQREAKEARQEELELRWAPLIVQLHSLRWSVCTALSSEPFPVQLKLKPR